MHMVINSKNVFNINKNICKFIIKPGNAKTFDLLM